MKTVKGRPSLFPSSLQKWPWGSILTVGTTVAVLVLIVNDEGAMQWIQTALATITAGILTLFGHAAVVAGSTVQTDVFGISVVTACTGLFTTGLYVIAVLAFPARWRARAIGLAMGIGGIFVLNLIRLVSLYFIGVHFPGVLDLAHQGIWQAVFIVFAVVLWLLWAGRWGRARRPASKVVS